jgi:hypothetical protein
VKSLYVIELGLFAYDPSAWAFGRLRSLKRKLFFTAAAKPPQ